MQYSGNFKTRILEAEYCIWIPNSYNIQSKMQCHFYKKLSQIYEYKYILIINEQL